MSLKIAASSVKSRFLRTLPIGTIYSDSTTNYSYQVVEKRLNNTLVKSAVPYLGRDEPIDLEVPPEMRKLKNPVKANISKVMKSKIQTILEDKCRSLMKNQNRSLYYRLKDILDNDYYEDDEYFYLLHSGLVLPFKKKRYATLDDAKEDIDRLIDHLFSDKKLLKKMMEKQCSIQSDLMRMVMNRDSESTDDED